MAPRANIDLDMAVQDICSSLQQLRRQQAKTKKSLTALVDQILTQEHHINQMDEMIDEHQCKLDALVQLMIHEQANLSQVSSRPSKTPAALQVSDRSSPDSQGDGDDDDAEFDQEDPVADPNSDSNDHRSDITAGSISKEKRVSMLKSSTPTISLAIEETPAADGELAVGTSRSEPAQCSIPQLGQKRPRSNLSYRDRIAAKKQLINIRSTRGHVKYAELVKEQNPDDDAEDTSSTPPTDPMGVPSSVKAARRVDPDGKTGYYCCGHRFSDRTNFKRHFMSKHTMERPYKCDYCDYDAMRKRDLRNHLKNRHDVDL